jgi:hypothetical protein
MKRVGPSELHQLAGARVNPRWSPEDSPSPSTVTCPCSGDGRPRPRLAVLGWSRRKVPLLPDDAWKTWLS